MIRSDLLLRRLFALAVVFPLAFLGSVPARAEVHIDINKPKVEPLPIAIPDFAGNAANEIQLGRDMTQVISADLERSGLFQPLDQKSFIEKITTDHAQPRFGDWRRINAQAPGTDIPTVPAA